MANSRWRVSVRKDADEIVRLVATERSDLARSPFQRAAWLETWFDAYGRPAPSSLFTATIEDAATGETVFVLPLRRQSGGGIVRLTAWDGGVSDYNAPVVSTTFAPGRDEMRALWGRLLRALPRADVLELEKVPATVGAIANPLLGLDGVRASRFVRHPLPLRQDGDFETLQFRRFDPSHRRSLAKKRRKLEHKGRLAFAFASGAEASATLDHILAWRGDRFAGKARPEEMTRANAFYRALSARDDIARVGRLTLDDRVIAGCFGTLTGSTFQLLAVAHDDEFKNWSPGLLAIESSIAALCAEGVSVYDFTIGDEPYKFAFGVESETLHELQAGLSVKGVVYLHARDLARRAKAWWQEREKAAAMPEPVEPVGGLPPVPGLTVPHGEPRRA